MPLWGFILSFVAAIMWAVSPIMVNHGLTVSKCTANEINPIRSFSFFLASLVAALVYTGGNITIVTSPAALMYIFSNVFCGQIIGDILFFIAIRKIGVGLAVPISNSYPVLVATTSWLILGEEITLQTLSGIFIVFLGLILLRVGDKNEDAAPSAPQAGRKHASRFMAGFIIALGAGLSWAISAPLTKLAMVESGLDAFEITLYRASAFFILAWGYRFFLAKFFPRSIVPLRNVPARGWAYFLAAAVIGLVMGSIAYATCIRVMPVSIVTAITSTSPFIAALFGHFVLKERLSRVQWLGIVLIIAGSVIVAW